MDFIKFSSVNTECLQHLLLWQQRHPDPTCLFSPATLLLMCLLYQTPELYLSESFFLMLLNIMVSASIFLQMTESYSLLFYFYWVDNTPLCVYDIFSFLFIHSYASRKIQWHRNSGENTNVRMSLLYAAADSFGCVSRSRMVGSYGSFFFCELSHWTDSL